MKLNNLLLVALVGTGLAFTGCKTSEDEEKQHYDNKLFLTGTEFTQEVKFMSGDNSAVEKSLTVGLAKPEAFDIKVTMAPSPDMISTYRSAYYDASAEVLPDSCYTMPETVTTISAGGLESPSLPIEFSKLGTLDRNLTYVLPVTVKQADGIEVLRSAKTFYYVFRAASLINWVCNISKNRAYPDFNNDSRFNNLSENTMEILFKADAFPNTLNTLMGIEGHYLLRLGDSGIPSNQLQIASSRNLTSTDLQFEAGQWYHLAVVFESGTVTIYVNGQEKTSGSVGRSSINLGAKHTNEDDGSRCFWVGYSYSSDRYFDGVISEVRIWNRALEADEIQAANHFYTVDAASDGLIAYWKFNEGTGKTVKDQSASGFNLTIEKDPTWVSVSLPEN